MNKLSRELSNSKRERKNTERNYKKLMQEVKQVQQSMVHSNNQDNMTIINNLQNDENNSNCNMWWGASNNNSNDNMINNTNNCHTTSINKNTRDPVLEQMEFYMQKMQELMYEATLSRAGSRSRSTSRHSSMSPQPRVNNHLRANVYPSAYNTAAAASMMNQTFHTIPFHNNNMMAPPFLSMDPRMYHGGPAVMPWYSVQNHPMYNHVVAPANSVSCENNLPSSPMNYCYPPSASTSGTPRRRASNYVAMPEQQCPGSSRGREHTTSTKMTAGTPSSSSRKNNGSGVVVNNLVPPVYENNESINKRNSYVERPNYMDSARSYKSNNEPGLNNNAAVNQNNIKQTTRILNNGSNTINMGDQLKIVKPPSIPMN